MLAVKDGLIALRIVLIDAGTRELLLGGPGPGDGDGPPGSVADPRALLLTGVADVVQAYWLAVLLELVFDLARQREGLRAGQIDAAIL
jgi:hypothetical protein